MAKLIPVLLILLGIGMGGAAGVFLRPVPDQEAELDAAPPPVPPRAERSVIEIPGQFIVPVDMGEARLAIFAVRLALEIAPESVAQAEAETARLRDGLLRALFEHANIGGFSGAYTDTTRINLLRRNLLSEAEGVLGAGVVFAVLITDILRTGS